MTTYSDTETQGVYERAKKNMRWAVDEIVRLRAELSALRSPAPAATVTGWRLLEVGEVIQAGDEIMSSNGIDWNPCVASVGKSCAGKYPIRRRLTPPAQGDEMRAVVKLADRWEAIADEAERMGESSDLISAYSFCAEQLRSALAAVRGAGGEKG